MDGLSRAVKKGTFGFALSVLVSLSANAALPPLPPGILLNTWPFDGTNLVTAKGTVPRGFSGVDLVPSWHSNAVTIPGPVALLQYNEIDTNAVTNIVCDSGTVMFWFSPLWNSGTGPGVFGRLIEMGQYTTNASFGWWSLYLDPSGSWVHFGTQTNGAGSNFLAAPISWQSNTWHHVGLTYSPSNSALYIDGQLATNGAGIGIYPGPIARWTNGLAIGSDTSGGNVANGLFDRMLTFNYPVAGNFISNTYQRTIQLYPGLAGGDGGGDSLQSAPGGEGLMDGVESGWEAGASSQGLTLGIVAAGSNVRLILYGTVPDTVYSIYSKPTLTSTTWTFEKNVTGATGQDWTDTFIPMNGRQMLFLRAGSTSDDTDGDGLSDAEEIFVTGTDPGNPDTGNTGIPDGYKDPDGDQWTNIDEIRNGTNPNGWDAPPAPFGLVVTQVPANQSVTLTWEPAPGPVQQYIIQDSTGQQWTVPANQTTLDDTIANFEPNPFSALFDRYRIQAVYLSGASLWSDLVSLADYSKSVHGAIVRGPQGKLYLVCSALPSSVNKIRVYRRANRFYFFPRRFLHLTFAPDVFYEPVQDGHFDLTVTAGTSVFEIPSSEVPPYGNYQFSIQGRGADASVGPHLVVPPFKPGNYLHYEVNIPFLDGRRHLKENLLFQLRAARGDQPFEVQFDSDNPNVRYAVDPVVVVSGFHVFGAGSNNDRLNEFSPFEVNGFFSNLVFNVNELSPNGHLSSGAYYAPGFNRLVIENAEHWFRTDEFINSADRVLPTALAYPASRWILGYEAVIVNFQTLSTMLGISTTVLRDGEGRALGYRFSAGSGYPNFYGLPFSSFKIIAQNVNSSYELLDLSAGGQVDTPRIGYNKQFYVDVQVPSFAVDQYLLLRSGEPMPGNPNFVLGPQKTIIASVGQSISLAAWAKLSLQNGDSTKQIYLQQYFDKAYKANPDGTRSTTETGILSEYGEFFPTEPGRTILTTKPDVDTGAVGECTVYVMKMELDVNHDGEINRTFHGPDNTSAARPFQFWLNNDYDPQFGEESPVFSRPDSADNELPAIRDLEDFTRLWISGVPPLDPAANFIVTLHWRNNSGPTIQLFRAYEQDGAALYLSDLATAQATVLNGSTRFAFATIKPGMTYQFPADFFSTFGRKHFIFEGISPGAGEMVLSVRQNGQLIAETSVFLEIKDIAEMYEYGAAVNVTSGIPPSTLVSEHKPLHFLKSDADEAKHAIVFVHGGNNTPREAMQHAATMFKRLYWAGYKGRFVLFNWPCGDLTSPYLAPFNTTDFWGYKSANALKTYVNYLKSTRRMADYKFHLLAYSQGNHMASEAIKQGLSVDTYIVGNASVPAHCYDVAAPEQQRFTQKEQQFPTAYLAAEGGYHGYFEDLPGRIVNFYNPDDFALAKGFQGLLETNWEKHQEEMKPEEYAFQPLFQVRYAFEAATRQSKRINNPFTENETIVTVTDPHEIRAMVARTRTRAIGAQGPNPGQTRQGSIEEAVDLKTSFGFGTTRDEHSAQYTRSIHQILPYFGFLLDTFDARE